MKNIMTRAIRTAGLDPALAHRLVNGADYAMSQTDCAILAISDHPTQQCWYALARAYCRFPNACLKGGANIATYGSRVRVVLLRTFLYNPGGSPARPARCFSERLLGVTNGPVCSSLQLEWLWTATSARQQERQASE